MMEIRTFAWHSYFDMRNKMRRLFGFGLIFITWLFWGIIFLIPFLKLGVKLSAILITILLIATNIFWVGVFLLGKEYAEKFKIRTRLKLWFARKRSS
jgi:predicted membrane protein